MFSFMSNMKRRGMHQAAFGSELRCPSLINVGGVPAMCNSNKWEFVEQVSSYRIRYRCKVCHKTLIYEFTNNPGHPYEVYGKNKWRQIVERWKGTRPLTKV